MSWNGVHTFSRYYNSLPGLSSLLLCLVDVRVERVLWRGLVHIRAGWYLSVLHSRIITCRGAGVGHQYLSSFTRAVSKVDGRETQRGCGVSGKVGSGINRGWWISWVWLLGALLYLLVDIILPGKNRKRNLSNSTRNTNQTRCIKHDRHNSIIVE